MRKIWLLKYILIIKFINKYSQYFFDIFGVCLKIGEDIIIIYLNLDFCDLILCDLEFHDFEYHEDLENYDDLEDYRLAKFRIYSDCAVAVCNRDDSFTDCGDEYSRCKLNFTLWIK